NTGKVIVLTGNSQQSYSGDIQLKTGDSESEKSGSIYISTGLGRDSGFIDMNSVNSSIRVSKDKLAISVGSSSVNLDHNEVYVESAIFSLNGTTRQGTDSMISIVAGDSEI